MRVRADGGVRARSHAGRGGACGRRPRPARTRPPARRARGARARGRRRGGRGGSSWVRGDLGAERHPDEHCRRPRSFQGNLNIGLDLPRDGRRLHAPGDPRGRARARPRRRARRRRGRARRGGDRRRPQRARAPPGPDRARRDPRPARRGGSARHVADPRQRPLRDARAVRDVRGRHRPQPDPARGLRHGGPEGRRGGLGHGRPRRAALQPPAGGDRRRAAEECAALLLDFFAARRAAGRTWA